MIGTIAGHQFDALVFPEHAECADFELGDSRISKVWLQRIEDKATVANFDRGWDTRPTTPIAAAIVDFLAAGLADSQLPYAILLQNHGYACNWNPEGFGRNSLLWRLAQQKGGNLPQWLFVATQNTDPWDEYHRASSSDYGGMHYVPRSLFTQD